MLLLAWVRTHLGGLSPIRGGSEDKNVLSKEGSGITDSYGRYWGCQFFNGKRAHAGGPFDCLLEFSGKF